jgi:hypothetical protein
MPNREQLTSTDPYNTTIFVGRLLPLVGEETLRTFLCRLGSFVCEGADEEALWVYAVYAEGGCEEGD